MALDRQPRSPLGATTLENLSTGMGLHAKAEAMLLLAPTVVWLVRAFQGGIPLEFESCWPSLGEGGLRLQTPRAKQSR